MSQILVREKQFWAEESGLLPLRLSPESGKAQYIMLDGGFYDFCLDLSGENEEESSYYSAAWSSDVKNYISIIKDYAVVYNWSRRNTEKVKLSIVQDKFHDFLKILNTTSYRTSDDVTPFILGLFAQLRNLTLERREPIEALNLLFKLLISLNEDNFSQEICDKWGIVNVDAPNGFDALLESIRLGVRHISPNLDYILRHGSGPLFETAHREALYFDPQLNLFGEISSNLGYAAQTKYSGVHYTPRFLVRSIVENVLKPDVLDRPKLVILDPACGSGTFLQEVLKQLREKNYSGEITIRGYDNSQMAVHTSKFLLNYENRSQWGGRISIDIHLQDSLTEDWGTNDIVLMNPPFISSELIKDTDTKEHVNAVLEDLHMKKRPNMAAAFLYKAIQAQGENGVLGAVLPSSILVQDQYKPLRDVARQTMSINTVAQLGNFVFSEALADTSFILGEKNKALSYVPLNIWCSNREQSAYDAMKGWRKMQYDNVSQRIDDYYNIYRPSHFPIVKDSWRVLPQCDDIFLQKVKAKEINGDLRPLINIFDVRQGVIKGNRGLFEISKYDYEQLPKSEKRLYRQMASSESIESGYVKNDIYLWYPYSQGELIIKTEDDLKQYEQSYQWLIPHKDSLLTRKGVNYWWDLTRSRAELFKRKETILCSKRSGESHTFAIAPKEFVVEEGNVFLFKNGNYCEDDKYFYLAFFSSLFFQRLLRIYARPLKSGYDLGKIQIKDIPVLDVVKFGIRESDAYHRLVQFGKEYSEGYTGRRDYFDKYVSEFY